MMQTTRELIDDLNDNSLYQTLGIKIESAGEGKAQSQLFPKPEVCWPFAGQPHGGILFTQMDTTMAWAVMSQQEPGYSCTTIDLNIQFSSPARGDSFVCKAWVTHRTSRISFVRADIHDMENNLLAMGQATFRHLQVKIGK